MLGDLYHGFGVREYLGEDEDDQLEHVLVEGRLLHRVDEGSPEGLLGEGYQGNVLGVSAEAFVEGGEELYAGGVVDGPVEIHEFQVLHGQGFGLEGVDDGPADAIDLVDGLQMTVLLELVCAHHAHVALHPVGLGDLVDDLVAVGEVVEEGEEKI